MSDVDFLVDMEPGRSLLDMGGLKDGVRVAESDEDKAGVILDYDEGGDLVSLEILDASRRVTDAARVEYETTE